MRFGKFTVIEQVKSDKSGVHYQVQCDCGCMEVRPARDLRYVVKRGFEPKCKKCGSIVKAANGKANKTHGFSNGENKKLYDVHRQMLIRCYNPENKDFRNYGGRGIIVLDQWHDIGEFIEWALLSGYREGLTIERVDVNGNYTPENCTWIENERQAHNTRKVRRVCGMLFSEAEKITGISRNTIKGRIKNGWNEKDALTIVPVIGRNQNGLPGL